MHTILLVEETQRLSPRRPRLTYRSRQTCNQNLIPAVSETKPKARGQRMVNTLSVWFVLVVPAPA